jgi:hypothetical protein
MTTDGNQTPRWETSSSQQTANTPSAEQETLVQQLAECEWMPRRVFALRCAAEDFYSYTVGHFVTTVVVATLLLGIALLVF